MQFVSRHDIPMLLCALLCVCLADAATLEKLSIEQMAEKATVIVRARVQGCQGEAARQVIYTRCAASVGEVWKGNAGGQISFLLPGGTAGGLQQTFAGVPSVAPGEEYVIFLWAGRSGRLQLIGLSQGLFDVQVGKNGQASVRREASSEQMLDSRGNPVTDEAVELTLAELRRRVSRALPGSGR